MDLQELSGRLKRAKIGIAGAGGLGSNAAMTLARAGVGHLLIVDFDRVEESNLSRQYYFIEQVGRYKVEALKENIEKAVNGCNIIALNRRLESGRMTEPFKGMDIVIEALDDAAMKARFIEEVLINLPDTPIIAASGVGGIGGTERIKLHRSGTLYLIEDPEVGLACDANVMLGPRVGLFAHYQAALAVEILVGRKEIEYGK